MTDNIKLTKLPEPDICHYVVTVWRDGVECEIDKGPRYTVEQMQAYAREAVRLNATVPDGDAAEAVHDTNAVLASRYFELLKVVEAYEKHGVTCQTFRHFVDTPCAECNCAPAAPQPAQQPLTDEQIKRIMLDNGFTIKEGLTDLKPYVYAAARALIAAATGVKND